MRVRSGILGEGRGSAVASRSKRAPDASVAARAAGVSSGSGLDLVRAWFQRQGWTPWPFQSQTWEAYRAGRSGLLQVPTGAGKTYAATLGPLAELIDEASGERGLRKVSGLRLLYITPLRAVARDIELAIKRPVEELGLPLSVESRTGDTSQSIRRRQQERLPNVLITTPESLTLMLSRENAREALGGCQAVVIDEWHELLSSKRGTQTELALARMRGLAPGLRTWALSATLENLEEAARAAVGMDAEPVIVRGSIERPVVIQTLLPGKGRLPWAGHMGLTMLPAVLEWLDPAISTLVFLNTRAQAELWYQAIRVSKPEWEDVLGLHQGSIDRKTREALEAGLKSGNTRIVVATSSLDLGVDFAPVERVMQIGSPKGLARLLQRAGRASHRPGAPCHIVCVPTFGLELVEVAAARDAIARGEIESRRPMDKPLDVLVQHLVTCSLGDGFRPSELFAEVRRAYSYRELTQQEFDWCLHLVRDGGKTLGAYPEHHRVAPETGEADAVHRVRTPRMASLHRLNVGTITGEMTLDLRMTSGKRLGSIEEYFIAQMEPGERFVFAGRVLEYVGIRDLAALVRPAKGRTTRTPHWAGTRLPISESLSEAVRQELELAARGLLNGPEMEAASPIIRAQQSMSVVPGSHDVLIEQTRTREGKHLFVYPFEGRLVNGGLAALLALRLSRKVKTTFSTAANDYGFELLTADDLAFETLVTPELFSTRDLAEDALASANVSDLAKAQFREVARVSGLVYQSYPGARKTGRQVFSTAALLYDVFREFDPDNLLLEQARREVIQRQFEQSRLARTLERLGKSRPLFRETTSPTPLGLPLVIERLGGRISSESLSDRIRKLTKGWDVENG